MEYLRRFRPDLVPTEAELHAVRFEFDPAPPLETLMLHFCGEIRLNHWYRCASEWHTEPVIKHPYETISRDEARHGGASLQYMKKAIGEVGDTARVAFAKIGLLMASARRTTQALHPTNLHVNKDLFPNDTVQSRLPEPGWLERWLDNQIRFDAEWEGKVVDRILHNLSLLFGRELGTVQALNSITIRSQVDGILVEIGFTEGQEVRRGDVLARIDPRAYAAALAQAEADCRAAEAAVELSRRRLGEVAGRSGSWLEEQKQLLLDQG
jgi:hypothetical protein